MAFDLVTLQSIPDDELESTLFAYATRVVYSDARHRRENFDSMPFGIQALYSTWVVDAEVNNGGFNQYFWNLSGEFAEEAVTGFTYFGALEHAALMREAIAAGLAEETQRNKFMERNTLEAFSESYEHTRLGVLDRRYFVLSEDLSALRVKAVRERPTEFTTHASTTQ